MENFVFNKQAFEANTQGESHCQRAAPQRVFTKGLTALLFLRGTPLEWHSAVSFGELARKKLATLAGQ